MLAGHRSILPHARVMVHQPHGGARVCTGRRHACAISDLLCMQGQATDIAIQAEEIIKLKALLNGVLSKHTKQPLERIGMPHTIG